MNTHNGLFGVISNIAILFGYLCLAGAAAFASELPYVAAGLSIAGYLVDKQNVDPPVPTFVASVANWEFAVQQTDLWLSSHKAQGFPMISPQTTQLLTGDPATEMGKCSWYVVSAQKNVLNSYAGNTYSSDGYDGESVYTVSTATSDQIECMFDMAQ